MLKTGDKLPNGATLLAAKRQPEAEGKSEGWTVLATNEREWITWTYVIPDASTGSTPYCVHGHYFDSFGAAARDYEEVAR